MPVLPFSAVRFVRSIHRTIVPAGNYKNVRINKVIEVVMKTKTENTIKPVFH